MRIEWAQPAELDLADIYAFIARDEPVYAEQFVDRLIETVALLRGQPLLGREVPEAKRADVRELIFHNYRIIYLVQADSLYIVAVIHTRRDLARIDTKPWQVI